MESNLPPPSPGGADDRQAFPYAPSAFPQPFAAAGGFSMAHAHTHSAQPPRLELRELGGASSQQQAQPQPQPQVTLPWGGAAQQAAPALPQVPVRPRHTPFTPPAAATPTSAWHPAAHNNRYNSPLYGKSRKRVASNTSSIMTDDAGFGAEAAKALEDAASAAPGSFWETEDSLLDDTKSEDGSPAVDDVSSVFSDRQSVSSSTHFALNGGSLQQTTSTFANVQRPTTPSGLFSGAQPPTTPSSLYSGVQPPTTPSSVVSGYDSSDEGRFRTGGITYTPLGNPKSRSNSSENLFARNYSPPPYDESKSGPMSCPPAFNASGKQPYAGSARGSLNGYPVQRSTELIASKLLPTKNSVNSLMGYVRELQLSEATLRDQLVKTKKTSEIEISKSKSKMSTLEKSIYEIEAEKEEAKRKLQEQERLIQQLSAKLREVEQQQKQQQHAGGLAIPPPIPEDSPLPEPVVTDTYTTVEETTTVVEGPYESENVSTTVTTEVARSSDTVQFETSITSEVIETHHTTERDVTEYTSTEDTSAEVTQSHEVSNTQDVPSLPPLQTEEQMQPEPTAPSGVMSPLSPTPLPWNPWGSGGAGSTAPPAFSIAPSAGIDLVSPSTQPPVVQETYSEQVTEEPQPATIEPAPVEHEATQFEQQHDSASYEDTSIASADAPQQEMYASAPFMSPTQYPVDGGSSSYPTSPMNPSFPAPVFSMGAVPPMEELYTPQHAQQTQESAYPANDQVAAEQHADHDQYAEQNGYAQYPPTEAYSQDQYAEYQQTGTADDYRQHGLAEQYQESTEQYQQPPEQYQQSPEEHQQSAEEYQHGIVEQSQYYGEDVVTADGGALRAPPASSFAETPVEAHMAPPVEPPTAPPAEPLTQPTEHMDGPPTESPSGPPTGPPLNGPPGGLPPAPPLCAPPTGPPIGAPPSPAGSQPPVETVPSTDAPVKDAAYLESLLTDFFTEFDKKKLKMAQVYAKRYFGREDVLFKELTRRYGKEKVSTLQSRYDGASADAPKVNTTPAPKSPAASTKHPHHQFFQSHGSHSDAPSANGENHSNSAPEASPPAAEYSADNGPPIIAPPVVQDSFAEPVVPGEAVSAEESHPSQETDVSQSLSTPPPPQTDEQSNAVRNGPPMFNYPPPAEKPKPARVSPRMQRRTIPPFGAPPSNMPPLPQPPTVGEPQPSQKIPEANSTPQPPMGVRPPPQAPGAAASSSQSAVAPPAQPVTLESLLMELYRKHQPDKIKNVSVVAREYAGKERELIRLLKGKYGALAVKRLEENLPALEVSSRRTVARKGGRGCFTCSIVILTGLFWTVILSVIAGVYVIDSYECQAYSGEDIDTAVSDGECSTLTSELKEFSHSKIGKYSHQSHSEACFCAEWKQREASLSSFESAVELAKLVPFSPGHFGGSLIEVVKDQLPLYDYASPIVQVMLDAGSMVWSESSSISGSASTAKKAANMDNSATSKDQVHSSDSVLTKVALASKSLANPQEYEASNGVEVLEDPLSETESETESESEPELVEASDYKEADVDSPVEEFVEVVVEQEGLDLSVASIDETEIDSLTAPVDEEDQNPTELAEVETDLNVPEEEFAYTAEEPISEEVPEEVVAEVTDNKQTDEVEEPKDENDIASTNDDDAPIESDIVTEGVSVDNEIEADASTTASEDSENAVVEDDAAADEIQDASPQEVVGEIAELIAEIVTLDVEVDSEQLEADETHADPEIEAGAAVDVVEVDATVGIEEVDKDVDVDESGASATAEVEETTAAVQVKEFVAELEVEEINVHVTDSTSEAAAATEESDEPVTRHEEVTPGLEEEVVVDPTVVDADSFESVVEVEEPGVTSIEEVANVIEVISPAHESAMDESDQTTDDDEVIVGEPAADEFDEHVISQVGGEEAVVGVADSEVDGNAKDDDLLDSTDVIGDVTESAAIGDVTESADVEDAVGEPVKDAAEVSEGTVEVEVEEASEESFEEAEVSVNPADVVDALYSEQDPTSAVAEADQAALDQLEIS